MPLFLKAWSECMLRIERETHWSSGVHCCDNCGDIHSACRVFSKYFLYSVVAVKLHECTLYFYFHYVCPDKRTQGSPMHFLSPLCIDLITFFIDPLSTEPACAYSLNIYTIKNSAALPSFLYYIFFVDLNLIECDIFLFKLLCSLDSVHVCAQCIYKPSKLNILNESMSPCLYFLLLIISLIRDLKLTLNFILLHHVLFFFAFKYIYFFLPL